MSVPAAQPFLAVLLRHAFPQRPIVVVTDGLKTQETFQQDIETWLRLARTVEFKVQNPKLKIADTPHSQNPQSAIHNPQFFYPSWEILPHEPRLPHADVISERLETLVALSANSALRTPHSAIVTTSVAALLQRTFTAATLQARTRTLNRGDRIEPLDLIEWLEEQGYEPEAQVTQKGEIALRGGILDVFPLTSPWPVRLEFFGDELESLRHFDPFTQVSRDQISAITLPPGGELGILKRMQSAEGGVRNKRRSLPRCWIICRVKRFFFLRTGTIAAHADNMRNNSGERSFLHFVGGISTGVDRQRNDLPGNCRSRGCIRRISITGRTRSFPNQKSKIANRKSLLPRRFPSAWPASAGAANRRSATAGIFRATSSLAAAGLCRPRFLQQRRRAAALRGNLEGIWFATSDTKLCRLHIGRARRGFHLRRGETGGRDGCGNFWALQSPAAAPAKSPHAQATRSALDIDFTDWRKAITSCICSMASGVILA